MASATLERMRISIELVPRNSESVIRECQAIREHFPTVNTINIPDVLRFDLRSWQGCACAREFYGRTIPHLRAIDVDPDEPLPMGQFLLEHGIDEVLVVTGDAPVDMSRTVYPTTSVELIKKIKRELPGVKVYGALDPYRNGFRTELEYVERKLDAGADGLFTQPFFDVRLMHVYAELLRDLEVFWGVTPVTTDRSRSYWETRNHAVFPADFQPTLEWNRAFAQAALDCARQVSGSMYFMPIRVDVVSYLQGIL